MNGFEPSPPASLTRRGVLASALALGAGAALAPGFALAQSVALPKRRIDVHHHFFPPEFLEAQRAALVQQNKPAKLPPVIEGWSKAKTLEAMDQYGIATAILSISTPGPWFGDLAEGARLARQCNDYAAGMIRDYPGRFGLFAALPLPDPDAALREIAYAFDTLKADGVGMMTMYATSGGDKWPGDAAFQPVFAELNRRKAIVFFHLGRVGSSQLCCGNVVPGVPDVMSETPQDMTRALLSLLFSGTLSRFPDIRFIFTNAGGTVPMLATRIATTSKNLGDDFQKLVPNGVEYELKKLNYDVSNAANPASLTTLSALVPPSQIFFGTDYPYVPIAATASGIDNYWGDAQRDLVFRANAAKLLPRLGMSAAVLGRILGAVAALALLAVPALAADHIKIGGQKTPSPLYIAVDRGYFTAEGIDPEFVYFDAGQPVAVAAVSGDIDFGISGLTGGLYALAEQGALHIIGGQNREVPGFRSNVIVASNRAYEAGLRGFKDLGGHSVAISQIGSSFHYDLALLGTKYGFELKSLKLMPVQSNPNSVSAVVGGSADAAVTLVSYALPAIERGDIKLLGYMGDEVPWQLVAVFTATKMVNQRGELVQRFLRAFRHAARDFHDAFTGSDGKRQDQATAPAVLAILSKSIGVPVEQVRDSVGYIDPELRIDVADIDRQVVWYKEQNLVKGSLEGHELIDMRYALPLQKH